MIYRSFYPLCHLDRQPNKWTIYCFTRDMYLTLSLQNSFFKSATQVKPARAGLGTGWVTCHEYPVMKAFIFSLLLLNIYELNWGGHGATYHCNRDLQVTRKGTSQSDCCNIVLQKGCFDWKLVQNNLQVQTTNCMAILQIYFAQHCNG